ncbi:M20/M25/M40 family metallo-hydrolase [Facklamia tabacinasalis]|uniref:M20/M25/M40 family metallo-hydrolase n=1 Tax=Ruoffia tabacinasalis TaxID=87458 RepID=A0ABS0LIS2_9LACT|nr:M20/M25/M40 family metallo-hydrolase [Ruoffia tabacinasalis]
MKAGLIALVTAMIEIKEANAFPPGTLRLLFTAGEESAQHGSKYLHENGYIGDIEAMIIAEPTGDVTDTSNLLNDKDAYFNFVIFILN